MNAGYLGGTLHNGSVVYDVKAWWEALDLVRLVGRLAESRSYCGSWLLGAELTRMLGRTSSAWGSSRCDAYQLTATSRATTRQILNQPRKVVSGLLRPLFRDIGSERVLDELEADPAASN